MAWCDVVEPCTLRECRIALGQSQAAFAATLGVSPESYRTWDTGRRVDAARSHARDARVRWQPIAITTRSFRYPCSRC